MCGTPGIIVSQDFVYQGYSWEDNASAVKLPDSLKNEEGVFLSYQYFIEFNAEIENRNQQLNVEHYQLYLNSQKAIEANNKIYIPQASGNDKYNKIEIRVVQPDGSVIELDKNDIKNGVDEDTGTRYSYYAIEGLEVGSQIEAVIKSQKYPQFYGRLFYIQKDYPIFDYHFEYISPKHLKVNFKTYNTDKQFITEEDEEDTAHTLDYKYVAPYKSETLSNAASNKEYFIFKLEKNVAQGNNDINGFGFFSQIMGNRGLNTELSKSSLKSIFKIYDDLKVREEDSNKLKALKVENYIKQNFVFIDNNGESALENLEDVLKQKAFNSFGAIQLYQELLRRSGLTCQVIGTCDKTKMKFDESFENYLFLTKVLLYIPEIKTQLDPSDSYSRLQYFDTKYQGHPGLFIKSRKVGGMSTATGKVKMIKGTSGKENLTKAIINVQILDGFDDIEIKVASEMTGHIAKNYQPYFGSVADEMRDNFYSYVMHAYADQLIMSSLKFENTEALDFPQNSLKAYCDLNNEDYWQKAGANYIINAGALIGPQSQMYNEDGNARRTPINTNYARRFQYEIYFNIPQGYTVENLEDLDFNIDGSNGDFVFYFKSTHTREGDKVKVIIDELYDHDFYPADQFLEYQKVINAAADFSKIKIIFKPN